MYVCDITINKNQKMTKGQKIKMALIRQSMSQQELAEKCTYGRTQISKACNDMYVHDRVYKAIENALNIKLL